MMRLRAEEKGLQLLLDQSSDFPRFVQGDEARLRQVLVNLVGNAVKFTEQGSVTLRLGAEADMPEASLSDHGSARTPASASAAEDQKRLFEPFVQVGKPAHQKGTGLGLAITRQFVELMGGTIGVESRLGKGSIFRIELPIGQAAEADLAQTETDRDASWPGARPARIPHPDRRGPERELAAPAAPAGGRIGFQVRVAENGAEGVEIFRTWHPHLIWMDGRMPVMDGLEATRRIRQLRRRAGGEDRRGHRLGVQRGPG